MNESLKKAVEEVAKREGKTFTQVLTEGAVMRVHHREGYPQRTAPVNIPAFGDPAAPKVTFEDIKRAIDEEDMAQARKWGLIR